MAVYCSRLLLLALASITSLHACDLHQHSHREVTPQTFQNPHVRRQDANLPITTLAEGTRDWEYNDSDQWGTILNGKYPTCGNGKQQSPINFANIGYASTHQPSFSGYASSGKVKGELFNWDFGPSYTIDGKGPALSFDYKTVNLIGWHMHFPAEHLVDGKRAQAEIHLVHADAAGNPASVVGIRVNVGDKKSKFFKSLPDNIPGPDSDTTLEGVKLNMQELIDEVGHLQKYRTYEGSLTTPPCDEGIRWFVAGDILIVSQQQFDVLFASNGARYSARNAQKIKNQHVNQ